MMWEKRIHMQLAIMKWQPRTAKTRKRGSQRPKIGNLGQLGLGFKKKIHVYPSQWTKHYRYIYIIQLTLIQHTDNKQNIVCNTKRLKLHLAVILQNCSITFSCNSNNQLLHTTFCLLQPGVTWAIDCCI